MRRRTRFARGVLVGALGGLLLAEVVVQIQTAGPDLGQDFWFYRGLGQRWLSTGELYLERQLAGPHDVALMVDNLYPPPALALFAPLALLPAPAAVVVWWGIPIIVLAATSRRHWWVWMVVLLWPRSLGAFIFGNSDIWAAAAVAAGIRLGWPAVFLVVKPVFAPLALVGVLHCSWWVAAGAVALTAAAALPSWLDYATVMSNVRGVGLHYSAASVPLVVAPVLVAGWSLGAARSSGQVHDWLAVVGNRFAPGRWPSRVPHLPPNDRRREER